MQASLYVAYGSPQQLTTGPGSNNKIEFGMDTGVARFGFSLAVTNLDGDNDDELVISAPTFHDTNGDAVEDLGWGGSGGALFGSALSQ